MGKPKKKLYFEVENIVDKRYNVSGLSEYLVKWKGYPSSQNTWEPKKNLKKFIKMIKEFETGVGRKRITRLKKGKLIGDIPDEPKKVIKIKTINKSRYCKLKWKKRRNNEVPTPSYIKYDIIKERYPYLILDFIEHHIHLTDDPQKKKMCIDFEYNNNNDKLKKEKKQKYN